jgi:hypothetical protein
MMERRVRRMGMATSSHLLAWAILLTALTPVARPDDTLNTRTRQILDEISEARIRDNIAKLVSFGTRNTMSEANDPTRGVGAARQWIYEEFKSYSPRLQVRFDKHRVKKQGERIFEDVDLYNVVAVLPGTRHPGTEILITAHYDSLNLGDAPPPAGPSDTIGERPAMTLEDAARNANLPAPGACDDGSGGEVARYASSASVNYLSRNCPGGLRPDCCAHGEHQAEHPHGGPMPPQGKYRHVKHTETTP